MKLNLVCPEKLDLNIIQSALHPIGRLFDSDQHILEGANATESVSKFTSSDVDVELLEIYGLQ